MSTATITRWNDLKVWDADGDCAGTLGDLVANAPANLDGAEIENGRIAEWLGFFIAAPGEDHDHDTPKGEVDWSGFEQALRAVRGA